MAVAVLALLGGALGVLALHTVTVDQREACGDVAVPADAPPLHRALGFAGRDPAWTP